jgi:hypothetical protein
LFRSIQNEEDEEEDEEEEDEERRKERKKERIGFNEICISNMLMFEK